VHSLTWIPDLTTQYSRYGFHLYYFYWCVSIIFHRTGRNKNL